MRARMRSYDQFLRSREECSRLALALVVIIRDRVRARTFMVLRAGCQLEWVSFPWSSTRERIGLRKLAPRATWTPSCCYLSARSVSLLAFVLLLVGAIGLSSRLRAATCRRDRTLFWTPSCCYLSARSVSLLAFVLLLVGAIGLSSRHLDAFVLLPVGAIGLSSRLLDAFVLLFGGRDRSTNIFLTPRATTWRRERSQHTLVRRDVLLLGLRDRLFFLSLDVTCCYLGCVIVSPSALRGNRTWQI